MAFNMEERKRPEPTIYVLINGRTNAVCGVYSSVEKCNQAAIEFKIDSWTWVARTLNANPVRLA